MLVAIILAHLTTVPDLERRQVRQKIIAHEKAHEDEIVHDALEIPFERQIVDAQFARQIFAQNENVQELKVLVLLGRGDGG